MANGNESCGKTCQGICLEICPGRTFEEIYFIFKKTVPVIFAHGSHGFSTGRNENARVGIGDRGTVSRHSFIPLPVRKTKYQVRKAQEKRQEEICTSLKLGGCLECISPGD